MRWQVFTQFPSTRSSVPAWSADVEKGLALALYFAEQSGRRWLQVVDMFEESIAVPGTELAQACRRIGAIRGEMQSHVSRFGNDEQIHRPSFLGDNPLVLGLTGDFSSLRRRLTVSIIRRRFRRKTGLSVVQYFIELGAALQAVRLGHPIVHPAHVLLSVLSLHDHMACMGAVFSDDLDHIAGTNVPILEEYGVSYIVMLRAVRPMIVTEVEAAGGRRRAWRSRVGYPGWSVSAVETMERARQMAAGQQVDAGTLHVLGPLLEADVGVEVLLKQIGVSLA